MNYGDRKLVPGKQGLKYAQEIKNPILFSSYYIKWKWGKTSWIYSNQFFPSHYSTSNKLHFFSGLRYGFQACFNLELRIVKLLKNVSRNFI